MNFKKSLFLGMMLIFFAVLAVVPAQEAVAVDNYVYYRSNAYTYDYTPSYTIKYYTYKQLPYSYYKWYWVQQPAPEQGNKTQPAQPTNPSTQPDLGQTQLSAYEQKVIELVNVERIKAGLNPLQADAKLSKVARLKSEDMRNNNYFSHTSPTYGSPFEMMKQFGISYRTAGENIAAGQKTPEQVVRAWMNSSGHRANILNKNYTQIGVGVANGGQYGIYWTQMFVGN